MKYRLIVAYDGTDFNGWQWQPHTVSVVGVMQQSFYRAFGHDIKLIAASRTDAGVHALGQVAVFHSDLSLDASSIMRVWNDALPTTIVIQSLEPALDSFHPMYGVDHKIYWYHFFIERPSPFTARYGWFFRYSVDMHLLHEALQIFVGTHDFRSFCTGNEMGQNTIRTIHSITLTQEMFGAWRITFKGPGFMRHMVRRIVGASFEVAGKKKINLDDLRLILEQKNPCQALTNAPAKGLCLYNIFYK